VNVAVFLWTTLVLSGALFVLQHAPRRPFEPTALDLMPAVSVALLLSVMLPT
jgi:hypothetical protein